MVAGLSAVFAVTTRNLEQLDRRAEMAQSQRVVLDQLRRDLAGFYPLLLTEEAGTAETAQSTQPAQQGITFVGEDARGPNGEPADNLRFTATLGGAAAAQEPTDQQAGRGDLAEVLYRLDTDPQTPERGLVRVINWQAGLAADQAQAEVIELAPDATSFDLRYYTDQEREGADAQGWSPEWQDVSQAPLAVEVSLGLTGGWRGAVEEVVTATYALGLRSAPRHPQPPNADDAQQPGGEAGAPTPDGAPRVPNTDGGPSTGPQPSGPRPSAPRLPSPSGGGNATPR